MYQIPTILQQPSIAIEDNRRQGFHSFVFDRMCINGQGVAQPEAFPRTQTTQSELWQQQDQLQNVTKIFTTEQSEQSANSQDLSNIVLEDISERERNVLRFGDGSPPRPQPREPSDETSDSPKVDVLKGVLKEKIKLRRLSLGKPDIRVDFEPVKSYKLTPEEEIQKAIRRQRNRVSATRCRGKKKEHERQLHEEYTRLRMEHAKLKMDVADLKSLLVKYATLLRDHNGKCKLGQTTTDVA
ncbi:hypothetical protein ScPMuIL_003571 [Solemya velum]